MAVFLVLPVARAAGWLSIPLVYAVLVILSLTGALYHNVWEAFLPELVPEARLDGGNAAFYVGSTAVGIVALVVAGVGPGLVPIESLLPLVVLGALLFAIGAAEPLFNVPGDSLVQLAATDANRDRVVTLTNAVLQVTFPVGYLVGGYLTSRLSPFAVFALSRTIMVVLGSLSFFRFGSGAVAASGSTA